MPLDESYMGESGQFTDYEGTVTDAYFGTWEKSTDPSALFIFLKMATDSPDKPEWTERYGLGTGWSTEDGGATVVNDRGSVKFHKKFSAYQSAWIDNAVPLLVEAGVAEEFSTRGPATKADVWVGTRWLIGSKTEKYAQWDKVKKQQVKDQDGNVVYKEFTQNIPVAFLGFAGEGSSNGQVADISFVPAELLVKVSGAAKASPTRDAFLDRVLLDVPEVQQVDGLVGKLTGKGVYDTLRGA